MNTQLKIDNYRNLLRKEVTKSPDYNDIHIYVDGSATTTSNIGACAIVLVVGDAVYTLRKCYMGKKVTSNRMEMMAVINAMRFLRKKVDFRFYTWINIYSDSAYIVNCFKEQWYRKWQRDNWIYTKNSDLWKKMLRLYEELDVIFSKVKGHSGHIGNELADALAYDMRKTRENGNSN